MPHRNDIAILFVDLGASRTTTLRSDLDAQTEGTTPTAHLQFSLKSRQTPPNQILGTRSFQLKGGAQTNAHQKTRRPHAPPDQKQPAAHRICGRAPRAKRPAISCSTVKSKPCACHSCAGVGRVSTASAREAWIENSGAPVSWQPSDSGDIEVQSTNQVLQAIKRRRKRARRMGSTTASQELENSRLDHHGIWDADEIHARPHVPGPVSD